MVLGSKARDVQQLLFTPIARFLLNLGVSPYAVTIVGTTITTAVALTFLPIGMLLAGSILLAVLVLADSVDGIMARESGKADPFGAFLDSTLDRISDSAVFGGVLLYYIFHTESGVRVAGVIASLGCLIIGGLVPYARAKAESLGVDASVGIAERADRLAIVLIALFITGLGAPDWVMVVVLVALSALSAFTVVQRFRAVLIHLRHV